MKRTLTLLILLVALSACTTDPLGMTSREQARSDAQQAQWNSQALQAEAQARAAEAQANADESDGDQPSGGRGLVRHSDLLDGAHEYHTSTERITTPVTDG